MNWFETMYPSPAFPLPGSDGAAKPGSTHYFSAYGAVTGSYPMLRNMMDKSPLQDPPEVLDLMHRVTLVPSTEQPLFAPRVTIFTKDGRVFSRQATGAEFIWDFEEEVRRIALVQTGIPISKKRFAELIDTCRNLESQGEAARTLISQSLAE